MNTRHQVKRPSIPCNTVKRAAVPRLLLVGVVLAAGTAAMTGCDPDYKSDGRAAGQRAREVGGNMKEWGGGFFNGFRGR